MDTYNPSINEIIAEDGINEEDLDPTKVNEIILHPYPLCENMMYGFLWNQHFQQKLLSAVSGDEQCYFFYSLNSFTHEKINFVCSECFDVSKYVWFNTIANAFSKIHHSHSTFIILCDKCEKPCNSCPQDNCNYINFKNGIVSENLSCNNWVRYPYQPYIV